MDVEEQPSWVGAVRRAVSALVASAVVVGVVLVGGVTAASADPERPGSSSAERPSGWKEVTRKVNGVVYRVWYNDALDPDDPNYRVKLAGQILVRRLVNRNSLGAPSVSELPSVIQDIQEYQRGVRKTVPKLKAEVQRRQGDIERYKKQVADAPTPAARKRAEQKLADARKAYNKVLPEYQKAKRRAEPFDIDKEISSLQRRIAEQDRKATNPRYTEAGRKQAREEAARLRERLSSTEAERDRSRGGDDDAGSTPAKKPDKPTNGPPTGSAKKAKGEKSGTKVGAKTGTKPSTTPKTGAVAPKPGTTAVTPKTGKPVTLAGPKATSRGTGGLTSAVVAANTTLLVQGYLDAEHRKWYDKAIKDPKLRARIIADYEDLKDNHIGDDINRSFDGSKEFASGTSRAIGEDLKKYQASLDAAKKVADKSNNDPLYQRARRECGGYDTCVNDRVKKLREQNAKAIARSDRNAKKSNDDPLYQQARRECGGYETCVKDRVKKLRAEAAAKPKKTTTAPKKTTTPKKSTTPKKATTAKKATTPKKTDPALAKKQYEEANRVCGGYDTCVKDRLAKVRGTGAKAGTPKKTGTPKKSTTSKKTKK
ncbi:MAG: hypothetical protein HOV94_00350 [Saccharothrix sp.]|nr:hypothetical protein [Saccharothrix sp.]